MGLFGDIFGGAKDAAGFGSGGGKKRLSPRQKLRQQTTRAKSLGKKVASAKEGGRRAKRLGKRQERLSGRMERTYGQMKSRREKRGMPMRQIGTRKAERGAGRRHRSR